MSTTALLQVLGLASLVVALVRANSTQARRSDSWDQQLVAALPLLLLPSLGPAHLCALCPRPTNPTEVAAWDPVRSPTNRFPRFAAPWRPDS